MTDMIDAARTEDGLAERLGQAEHLAHDRRADRALLDAWTRARQDAEDEALPAAWAEPFPDQGAVEAAAGRVAAAARFQLAVLRDLAAAARDGGADVSVACGETLRDTTELVIHAAGRRVRVTCGDSDVEATYEDQEVTHNGLPTGGSIWLWQVPGFLGLPDEADAQ